MVYQKEIKKVKQALSESLVSALELYGGFLAGGSLTSLLSGADINDYDIYLPDQKAYVMVLKAILDSNYETIVVCKTDKALLMKCGESHVQLITGRFYYSAQEIFDTFDFTVNMVAYDFKNDKVICNDSSIKHIAQRRLVINPGTRYPMITLQRVFKYVERGYKISKLEMMKLALMIQRLQLDTWDDVKEQLSGLYGVSVDDIFDEAQPTNTAVEQLMRVEPKTKYPDSVDLKDVITQAFIDANMPLYLPADKIEGGKAVWCDFNLEMEQNGGPVQWREVWLNKENILTTKKNLLRFTRDCNRDGMLFMSLDISEKDGKLWGSFCE